MKSFCIKSAISRNFGGQGLSPTYYCKVDHVQTELIEKGLIDLFRGEDVLIHYDRLLDSPYEVNPFNRYDRRETYYMLPAFYSVLRTNMQEYGIRSLTLVVDYKDGQRLGKTVLSKSEKSEDGVYKYEEEYESPVGPKDLFYDSAGNDTILDDDTMKTHVILKVSNYDGGEPEFETGTYRGVRFFFNRPAYYVTSYDRPEDIKFIKPGKNKNAIQYSLQYEFPENDGSKKGE